MQKHILSLYQADLPQRCINTQKATSLDSNIAEAYLELGAVLNQTKEYPQAETALLQGLELKPEAARGPLRTGEDVLGARPLASCGAQRAQSGSRNAGVDPARALLGNVMLRESNAQGALHEYQEYSRLDPNGSMAPGVWRMIERSRKPCILSSVGILAGFFSSLPPPSLFRVSAAFPALPANPACQLWPSCIDSFRSQQPTSNWPNE
jgi:tetratricopeptide (TPR) repeat protein